MSSIDVDKAVRELGGVWPSSEPEEVYLYQFAGGRYAAGLAGGTARYICTLTEFFECARRLRNEPSWRDAPDWAVAKAQDSDGEWVWFSAKPITGPEFWVRQLIGRHRIASKGEVIGDWKQTLKLRPDQEDEVKNKNDWHTKGELPPAGTVFKFSHDGSAWCQQVMLYNDGVSCLMAHPKHTEVRWHYKCDDPAMRFHPIQSKREEWVGMVVDIMDKAPDNESWIDVLGRAYDAGLASTSEET